MSNNRVEKFDDETILELFGAQAAEDETAERLKAYFLKNRSYERIRVNIPLRIIVGHKGVGKSALLRISYLEDIENDHLALWLQPNDISKSWSVDGNFVERVEGIKKNILAIIAEKAVDRLTIGGHSVETSPILSTARQLIGHITQKINQSSETSLEARILATFQQSNKITIYVDDIDRGWAATRRDVENISALINAARDLSNEDNNVRFRIGIRTDAYNLVREHDESGDKFEPNVVPLFWTNHDILLILAKRVAGYFDLDYDPDKVDRMSQLDVTIFLYPIIIEKFDGAGHWSNRPIHNVLLSLTRRRPRDLIKLLAGAARAADTNNNTRIMTSDLVASFPEYSKGRITDLISEFRSELPEIEKVLYSMKPTSKEAKEKKKASLYRNDELISKLNRVAATQNISFKNGRQATGQSLAEFLYKIDFVIARRDHDSQIERFYYQDHSKLQSNFVDFGFSWEIHPAYRWALNPTDVNSIIAELDI